MINFSALYLSFKRLGEVVSLPYQLGRDQAPAVGDVTTAGLQRARLVNAVEEEIIRWLREANLPSLGELIVREELTEGVMFTHLGPFWGRAMMDAATRYEDRKPVKTEPRLRAKLGDLSPGATLDMFIHPENFTSVSSSVELSGQKRLFVVARLTEADLPELKAQAYAVGFLHDEPRAMSGLVDRFGRLPWQMEVFVPQIDSFSKVDTTVMPTAPELKRLGEIPEGDIKTAFAGIVGEPFVPKDWGGETSDLTTTQLVLMKEPVATAFAFKGPAKFAPLTVAHLGKNGDQISRLFSEPVDFVVLQHCHRVTSAVRNHMRAFGTRTSNLRPFCIIDGADTVRILKAYNKLGYA